MGIVLRVPLTTRLTLGLIITFIMILQSICNVSFSQASHQIFKTQKGRSLDKRLLQNHVCNKGMFLESTSGNCIRCHESCASCIDSLPMNCTACYTPMILRHQYLSGETASSQGNSTENGSSSQGEEASEINQSDCMCPLGYYRASLNDCKQNSTDTKANIIILIVTFLVIFLFSYFIVKAFPDKFGDQNRIINQSYHQRSIEVPRPMQRADDMDATDDRDHEEEKSPYDTRHNFETEGVLFTQKESDI